MNLALAYYQQTLQIGTSVWKIVQTPAVNAVPIQVKELILNHVSGKDNHSMCFNDKDGKQYPVWAHHYNEDWFETEDEAVEAARKILAENLNYIRLRLQALEAVHFD